MKKQLTLFSIVFAFCQQLAAQEFVVPLDHNLQQYHSFKKSTAQKTTANTLPFFEDFTDHSIFPDPAKWVDRSVYLNNTMGANVISRGVATFDALNEKSGPYDSSSANSLLYADSLTSVAFDLSAYQPGDSLYFSFFYQPQGNGFAPEPQDSLMLYMKSNNGWRQVWSKEGSATQPFKQVMIPVNNTIYFHNDFQFRFVNKASINVNDDVWNVDYIRFAANRTINDTAVNDVTTTAPPTFLLNDYTSMPYRQFAANMNGELLSQHSFNVLNNTNAVQSVASGYSAREAMTNTVLFPGTTSSGALPPSAAQIYQYPLYNISFSAGTYDKVIFENKYFVSRTAAEPKANDTIIQQQVFDNYLAYDDGTAEKSYFLKQFATLPAKLAIEYRLNQPDSLRGVAIYFGRQVPLASWKFFNVQVYKDIAINGGSDDLLFEQQLLFPSYTDTVNKFWIYRLDEPVALATGAFFVSIMQPAASGSDSLYYGLDVNRTGSNHAYFNVLNVWQNSTVNGAVMIRPILGNDIIGTSVEDIAERNTDWSIYPNPATTHLTISVKGLIQGAYEITDVQGRRVMHGKTPDEGTVNISNLQPGVYFIRTFSGKLPLTPKKFLKL